MKIKSFILQHIRRHGADIVTFTADHFNITRPAVFRHIQGLLTSGKITATGRTKNRRYQLVAANALALTLPVSPALREDEIWAQHIQPRTKSLPKNVQDIFGFGVTEMVNNVLDHAQATTLHITAHCTTTPATCTITDNGVGIFHKIQTALQVTTPREAILHLTKGQFTTDPAHHSGQGIFFTSRVFDCFSLRANGVLFRSVADADGAGSADWMIETDAASASRPGTAVTLAIAPHAVRTLREVFARYSDPEDLSFDTTEILVELGKNPEEHYFSRSQAKRIVAGLEKFRHVILDFRRVNTVGQGFVDEIFRVFQRQHPHMQLTYIHANADVTFMIKRSLPP